MIIKVILQKSCPKKGILAFVGVRADEIAIWLGTMEEREKEKDQLKSSLVHRRLLPGKKIEVLTKSSLGIQG